MQTAFYTCIFFLSFFWCPAQNRDRLENSFELRGSVPPDIAAVYLYYQDKDDQTIVDTISVKDGYFSTSGVILEPTFAALSYKPWPETPENVVRFFLEPTKMSIVSNHGSSLMDATFSGSKTQEDKTRFDQIEESDEKVFKFIKGNTDSYLSGFLLLQHLQDKKLPIDSARSLFALLSPNVRNSKIGEEVSFYINLSEDSGSKGSDAPNFNMQDLDGNEVTLVSLLGQSYILIDFWASWCQPCREATPQLKQLHERYDEKELKIVSISLDFEKEDWQKAVMDDGIDQWLNLYLDFESNKGMRTKAEYDVSDIPLLILIDRNGKIVERVRGIEEDLGLANLSRKLTEYLD